MAVQKLSPEKRRLILWGFWGVGLSSCIYGLTANHIPSEIVTEYGPLVWAPLALGFFIFLVLKCFVLNPFAYDPQIARWKKIAGTVLLLAAALCFAKVITTAVVPELFNRLAGNRFQAQTTVTRKYSNEICGYCLGLACGETIIGGISVSESVWKAVSKGDIVNVFGVQSILGQTIDTVRKP